MSGLPSLSELVVSRSFKAPNGELGLLPSDAATFLDACEADDVGVLGWEVWLANHEWDVQGSRPRPAQGEWCGLIPGRNPAEFSVLHGSGDLDEVRRQIAALDLGALIEPRWLPHARLNFTLDD